MARVFVLYTGGTFGGVQKPDGVAPAPTDQLAALLPATDHKVTVQGFGRILDSSSIVPGDWVEMAQIIRRNYDGFDGFAILHGTDSMAYTSSALSRLFQGLTKPVVLTGSQVPLSFANNDAAQNYLDAVALATTCNQPAVWVQFGGKRVLGSRAVKISCESWQAFGAPKGPGMWTADTRPFAVQDRIEPDVRLVYCHPGQSVTQLCDDILRPAKGLVIASYGVGNLPNDARVEAALTKVVQRQGTRVIQVTQCAHGAVDPGFYASGSSLVRSGVEAGGDLTIEGALTKLMVELAQ